MSKAQSGQPPVRKKPSNGKYEKWLTEDGLAKLQAWARNGLTDEQIAHNCGISASTLYAWKVKYQEISEALKDGKEAVDLQVENALLKRALGFEYEEVTHERVAGVMVLTKTVTKMVVPDVTAQIYWLKNRKRDTWKDNHDHAEAERERVAIERLRVEADIKDKAAPGTSTVSVVMDNELRELSE